jgi:hypothetical protein
MLRWIVFLIVSGLAIFQVPSREKCSVSSGFTIIYRPLKGPFPSKSTPLLLFPQGEFQGTSGNLVDLDELPAYFQTDDDLDSRSLERHLVLYVVNPKNTSPATLSKALSQLRTAADPNRNATVYVVGVSP